MDASKPVLIIEDDADIRESLQQVLELEGYSTASAANGREALDVLTQVDRPSLILLDLMMPVMNGWEFLVELGKNPMLLSIPVIVVSAAGDVSPESLPGKVAGYLKKPVDMDQLLAAIDEHQVIA